MGKRLLALFTALFWMLLFSSCHGTEPAVGGADHGLFMKETEVDGRSRRYAIYIPQNLGTRPVPLVFSLHGGGVYIEDMTGQSGHKSPHKLWMEIAEREKIVVVYPEGLNGAYGKPTWNDCRGDATVNSGADDLKFLTTLIDEVAQKYPVERKRVYASGISNGGFMALRLGVEAPEKFAAVAAIAAAMPAVSKCRPPQVPISVLFMNGTADKFMPYGGGTISNPPKPEHGTALSTEESVQIFTTLDAVAAQPEVYRFADLDPNDGGRVTRYRYLGGIDGTEVVLYKVEGGGHSAPSIKERYSAIYEYYFGKQNHDIEAVEEIWSFFKRHSR